MAIIRWPPRACTTTRSSGARSATGPDLARVGSKYSDDWHRDHLHDPRSVVPDSIMPAYPCLLTTDLDYRDIADD